ncbi:MAG TPA: bifunctional demethylmenaquinone methyltransferase/2-methoxy-6-polyprenyl-1,4-benzoquinol methylase UbiE [Bryobacteraceae bacterium]|nr:bifunctional demethylmenaquinone methyltransferase/2-methoxy-6-polyprenyl-1,4-benzoquinol methylase UbiE [Bryobacteraceae bacterium]
MKAATGTTPPGTENEQQAAGWVRQMFTEIAPRYDLLNHLLSFNIDRGWRRALLGALAPVAARTEANILDLCCGTGDVLLDLTRISKARTFGADFCHPMLVSAQQKAARRQQAARLFEADAMVLPLADGTLDAIAIAFGFRNLSNYRAGLAEFARVLKPGGVLAILEFSHPPSAFVRAAYSVYARFLLPAIGGMISGSRAAYSYLPESIAKFPRAAELKEMMRNAGFAEPRFRLLSGGIAALHTGTRG